MQALAKRFVCVADEVFRLQKGKSADADFFRKFCEKGHYGGRTRPSNTRQGIYAAAADASFLASVNTRRPEGVVRMLEQALERFDKLAVERRVTPAAMLARVRGVRRAESEFPKEGLVLRVTTRDLPGATQQRSWHAGARNRDWAWFRKTELRGLLPELEEGKTWKVGQRGEVRAQLISRLVRCHLVDNVRGQTSAFSKRDVEHASLSCRVTRVEGERVELEYHGRSRAVQSKGDWPRGFVSDLRGRATWNASKGRFESFLLLADAKRWGRTRFNSREAKRRRDRSVRAVAASEKQAEPIVALFELLPAAETDRVAPAFVWKYGW